VLAVVKNGTRRRKIEKRRTNQMFRKIGLAIGALALATGVLVSGSPARAQGSARVGTLNCSVASGWGFVFGSSRALHCTFAPTSGPPELYAGSIQRFGVDIGYTKAGVLVWAVLAPAERREHVG
jgi:hypothetical protein